MLLFFFKQKTAYEMRISDWSSDVCSSDLPEQRARHRRRSLRIVGRHLVLGLEQLDVVVGGLEEVDTLVAPRRLPPGRARDVLAPGPRRADELQLGRAPCRDRVCQSVSLSVAPVPLKNNPPTRCPPN